MCSSGIGGDSMGLMLGICKNRPGNFKGSERVTNLRSSRCNLPGSLVKTAAAYNKVVYLSYRLAANTLQL